MPKAIQFSEYGDPDVLELVDVDPPEPSAGQVRVKVAVFGINPIDWKIRKGFMAGGKPLAAPRLTGLDFAGTVDAVGEGVQGFSVGDRVAANSQKGASAEYVVAAAKDLTRLPDSVDFATGAALGVVGTTAIRVLELSGLESGQRLLLHAATGGVGAFTTQLAVARGITVIGTAGGANQEYLRSLGAIPVVYGDGWLDRVRAASPGPIDAVIDAAGSGVIPDSLELVPGGPVITIADFSVQDPRVTVSTGSEKGFENALAEAVAAVADGTVTLPVEATFPLERTADAHRLSETRHVRGKILVTIP